MNKFLFFILGIILGFILAPNAKETVKIVSIIEEKQVVVRMDCFTDKIPVKCLIEQSYPNKLNDQ